jgi:hypothetical protein
MLDHLLDLAGPTPLVLPFAIGHSPRPLFFCTSIAAGMRLANLWEFCYLWSSFLGGYIPC